MSYQRQWYAPMGAAPGQTPTNAEKAAVAAFQASMNLPADGIVGPATTAAMAKVGMTLADVYAGKQVSTTSTRSADTKKLLVIGGALIGGTLLIVLAMGGRR